MGGIGPTHDDLTMRGVAAGLGVGMAHSTAMEHFLHKFKKTVVSGGERAGLERLSCQTQRMCMLPEGTELLMEEAKEWPLLRCGNVFMLPGVPKFCRQQMAHVCRILGCQVTIFLKTHESPSMPPLLLFLAPWFRCPRCCCFSPGPCSAHRCCPCPCWGVVIVL